MNPKRISVSVDEQTLEILKELDSEEDISRSELLRRAVKFYHGTRKFREYGTERLDTYLDLLSEGEHVVLDIDRWLLFLDMLDSIPEKEEFWKKSEKIAESHAEQLSSRVQTPSDLLERLAACNFFRLSKTSDEEFTLIVNSEKSRRFVKRLLEDFSQSMGFDLEIQEGIGKLRVSSKSSENGELS